MPPLSPRPKRRSTTRAAAYPPPNPAARAALLQYLREAPLVVGEWSPIKRIYKRAAAGGDAEVLGTLIGRLDAAPLSARRAVTPLPALGPARAIALRGRTAYLVAERRQREEEREARRRKERDRPAGAAALPRPRVLRRPPL